MNFKEILEVMVDEDASDVFVKAGSPLKGRVLLELKTLTKEPFSEKDVERIISGMLNDSQTERLKKDKSYDFAAEHGGRWRFRIAIFYQRGVPSIVIRKIDLKVLSFRELNLPPGPFEAFCAQRQGLVLLTGITGSGKSTSIAAMIEFINKNLGKHILTVEEPIEFTFESRTGIINQRELGSDVSTYADALKQFALHSPDVIYIGNIRDRETCQAALTAAETGVLVLSTMHSIDAPSTVERIANFFPPQHHDLIFSQLSTLLKGVVSLRLIPRSDIDGLIPAYEIMTLSPSISALIRERNVSEMPKIIAASSEIYDMNSFNQCLTELVEAKKITTDTALAYSNNREDLAVQLRKKEFI